MTLLERLQSSLNKLYDGNITANNAQEDYESGESYVDYYKCSVCDFLIKEEEWDSLHKCCKDCWHDYCEDQAMKHGKE